MKDSIKRIPISLCGVMLGLAALGNLLQSYSEGVRYICGIVSGLLLILILLKLILFPALIKEDMRSPIMASVSGTFPMALMLLSIYAKPFIGQAAYYIWLFAIAMHIVLIIYFTVNFIVDLQMPQVFASYYIVYVGIAAAAVTAPAYNKPYIGNTAFLFGFISMIILLILITARYARYQEIPDPVKPLICIYAAPANLCIAGYIQSSIPKSYELLLILYILASVLYVFALIKAIRYFKLPFFPSYASFTFPFVISAIASKQTMTSLAGMEHPIPSLKLVVIAETIIAAVFVLYTLVRFLLFIFAKPHSK